jgi:hypothetical protein
MISTKLRTIVRLVIEYLLITLPIIIYITLEAIHQKSAAYLLQSPEWSIATIFLSFQTVRLFLEGMERDRGRLICVALVTLLVLLVTAASINTYMGLESGLDAQSWTLLVTKWVLLAAATLFFVYFAGAAIWAQEAHR